LKSEARGELQAQAQGEACCMRGAEASFSLQAPEAACRGGMRDPPAAGTAGGCRGGGGSARPQAVAARGIRLN